jgi:hypothetical protein
VLALASRSLEQVIGFLNLRPGQVWRHLERLVKSGLVETQDGLYRLDVKAIEGLSRRVLANLRARPEAAAFDGEAYDRKVLSDFLDAKAHLKSIPAQPKKVQVILRHIAPSFEPGVTYTEKEINAILQRFYFDSTTLRRYLVDSGYLGRDPQGRSYWRICQADESIAAAEDPAAD